MLLTLEYLPLLLKQDVGGLYKHNNYVIQALCYTAKGAGHTGPGSTTNISDSNLNVVCQGTLTTQMQLTVIVQRLHSYFAEEIAIPTDVMYCVKKTRDLHISGFVCFSGGSILGSRPTEASPRVVDPLADPLSWRYCDSRKGVTRNCEGSR